MSKNQHRLSPHIKPSKYHLRIQPNLADFSFAGSETIQLDITRATKKFVLHAAELSISDAKLVIGREVYSAKISYQAKAETAVLTFAKPVKGKGRLHLDFNGHINDQLRGMYRSKYSYQGKEKYLATTQFEATDARRAFPCFDEPAHKAKFIVEVVVPEQHSVISNTVEQAISPHRPGYKIVRFAPTPKMSTYLLAMIMGELEHITGKSKRGVEIRVHTTPGKKAQGKFALEFTKKALDYLENYFDIPYPLPVLDLIAIPDFAAGAMENWGAITFRETLLLVDEAHSPFNQKQRVAEVIAHELVHQWFGNLVTMEWWTHLWLNESFATYMAYVTVDATYPDWNFWTKFVLEEQSFALQQDSLHVTHPIEVEVKHPNEIAEIFDAISYAKGASVLRMLSSYIGEDNFQRGLSHYLKKHSYKNTSSVHLWEAFELVSGLPVRQMMKAWTTKPGFPVVSARLKNGTLHLRQQEFKQLPAKTSKQLWPIPLTLQTKTKQFAEPQLFKTRTAQLKPQINSDFFNLDYNDSSLTIIDYDASLLAQLLPKLQARELTTLDRLALVRDGFLLAKSGQLPTEAYLEILTFLNNETSYVIWSEVSRNLSQLERMLAGSPAADNFQLFKRKLFAKVISRKELEFRPKAKESHNNAMLRGLVFAEAGSAGFAPAKQAAKTLFMQSLKGKAIDPNLRSAAYMIMARFGGAKVQTQLEQLHNTTEFATHKQQLLNAMINGATINNQDRVLKFIYGSEVRDQDRVFAVAMSLMNPSIKSAAWQALVKNWPALHQTYGNSKMAGTLLTGAQSFNSPVELAKFQKFLKGKTIPAAKQAIAQTLEKIKINIAWRQRDLAPLSKYFKKA